jgi:hypothetical protein
VILQPPRPAAAQVAQAVENNDSTCGFHCSCCGGRRIESVHERLPDGIVPENCVTQPKTSICTGWKLFSNDGLLSAASQICWPVATE